ncbi:MAG TPA: sigma factor-like helix-turn-helix DNA-binding protein [Tepidisphaeraceae bacterium]|nr:sigma factor-like helix-turn-helix DNA-binding protein [Tepidisphaeraceae bacterium]
MPITEEMLARAKQHRRAESEQLLAQTYAPVYRIAHALLGRADLAAGVVARVMRRALARVEKWRDDADAQRWFLHHTIIEVRRTAPAEPPDANADLLVARAEPGAGVAHAAFVRAVRALPPQQREAVVLHHAAHLNERYVAVAMDCSTSAAQAHLAAGNDTLRAVAGGDLDARLADLGAAYRNLGPAVDTVAPAVRRVVAGDLRARRWRVWGRLFVGVLATGALAAATWYAWTQLRG